MRLTNESYLITLRAGGVEYYFRDGDGWVKQTTRGRRFKASAEQVLNHLLPALAGVKPGISVEVLHRDLNLEAATRLAELRTANQTRSG
jgi:hypothetical protein